MLYRQLQALRLNVFNRAIPSVIAVCLLVAVGVLVWRIRTPFDPAAVIVQLTGADANVDGTGEWRWRIYPAADTAFEYTRRWNYHGKEANTETGSFVLRRDQTNVISLELVYENNVLLLSHMVHEYKRGHGLPSFIVGPTYSYSGRSGGWAIVREFEVKATPGSGSFKLKPGETVELMRFVVEREGKPYLTGSFGLRVYAEGEVPRGNIIIDADGKLQQIRPPANAKQ
jgi:hypothetical protein